MEYSHKFKVGDRVVCIDQSTDGPLRPDLVYTVVGIDTMFIDLGDSGIGWWSGDRFEPYIKPVTLPEELFVL